MLPNTILLSSAILVFFTTIISSFVFNQRVSFPLREFYNTTDNRFLKEQESHLCTGIPGFSESGCCSCIDSCIRFKSCCVNYLWDKKEYIDVSAYKKLLSELSRTYRNHACHKTFPMVTKKEYRSAWNYMIDECQLDNDSFHESKILCEQNSSSSLLPVIGNDGYLYRNPYCSTCNGIKVFEMIPIAVNCALTYPDCEVVTEIPREISTTCKPFIKNSCDKYHDLCHAFAGPYRGYANYFCYLCNTSDGGKNVSFSRASICSVVTGFKPLAWSSLFQFSSPAEVERKCEENEVPSTLGICINYYCPPGYTASEFRCIKDEISSLMNKLNFDECFFTKNLSIFVSNTKRNMKTINYILGQFKSRSMNFYRGVDETFISIKDDYLQNYITIPNVEEISNMLAENSIVQIIEKKNITSSVVELPLVYTHKVSCGEKMELNESVTFTPECNAVNGESVIPEWNLFMSIDITNNKTKRTIYACKTYYDGCPLRVLDSNASLQDDGTLTHRSKGIDQTYNIKEYTLISQGVYGVCVDVVNLRLPSWHSTVQNIEGYISVTGSFLSIISYIIVLVTLYLFEKPFNLPTHCVIALCTNLFFADALFLAINILHFFGFEKIPLVCDVIGSLDHFFLISSQIWCVVMAVNLIISLKSINRLDRISVRSRFIKYCLLVHTISLVTVILAVVLREAKILDDDFEKREICLFSAGLYVRMIMHVLPLIASFTTSMVIISTSLYHVAKEKQRNNKVLGRSRYINITKIALKLIIMFGIPEGIGLMHFPAAKVLSNEFYVNMLFGVLYSTVKGFRGVMFLVLYVCKKSVVEMYKMRVTSSKDICLEEKGEQQGPSKERSENTVVSM